MAGIFHVDPNQTLDLEDFCGFIESSLFSCWTRTIRTEPAAAHSPTGTGPNALQTISSSEVQQFQMYTHIDPYIDPDIDPVLCVL